MVLKIAVTGGTGFLGRSLCRNLLAEGHDVVVVTRSVERARRAFGSAPPPRGRLRFAPWSDERAPTEWRDVVTGADAFVNLAGESIADGRWSEARKRQLYDSRILITRGVTRTIKAAKSPPPLLVSASAVGYYGPRGDELLTEQSSVGHDFLASLCADWEEAATRIAGSGTKVALLRTGLVLSPEGGALKKMILPFRLGFGGRIGNGRQYMPWIHRSDWIAMVKGILEYRLEGPFNLTAPNPVTNADFTRSLGRALGRPTPVPLPAFAVKLLFGEMGEALLLSGQRAIPKRAIDMGFSFRFPTLDEALQHLLRPGAS